MMYFATEEKKNKKQKPFNNQETPKYLGVQYLGQGKDVFQVEEFKNSILPQ